MTAPTEEEAIEAARRVIEAFAWAQNYKPHRNRPERDAYHAAVSLLALAEERDRMREALEVTLPRYIELFTAAGLGNSDESVAVQLMRRALSPILPVRPPED